MPNRTEAHQRQDQSILPSPNVLLYYADSDGDLESSDESPSDQCSPQALGRAQGKVEELQRLLGIAKTHYQQLGGELVEDSESRLLENEHKKLAHLLAV